MLSVKTEEEGEEKKMIISNTTILSELEQITCLCLLFVDTHKTERKRNENTSNNKSKDDDEHKNKVQCKARKKV